MYRKIDELTSHVSCEQFHLRLSMLPGYDKETFDVNVYSAQQRDRNALEEAAAIARSAAAAARQAQAAAAVASPVLLQGELSFPTYRFFPSVLPFPASWSPLLPPQFLPYSPQFPIPLLHQLRLLPFRLLWRWSPTFQLPVPTTSCAPPR